MEMLAAAQQGNHALLVAPTGAGKTLASFLPTIADLIVAPTEGLHTLYVSPLKALAVDVRRNLLTPRNLAKNWPEKFSILSSPTLSILRSIFTQCYRKSALMITHHQNNISKVV